MFFGKKPSEESDEDFLEPVFQYELGDLRLRDGRLLRPLDEAIKRWITFGRSPYEILGTQADVLYQLPDNRWLKVTVIDCRKQGEGDSTLFIGEPNPTAEYLEPIVAAHFLLNKGERLTDGLRTIYNEWIEEQHNPPPPTVRPLSYWLNREDEIVGTYHFKPIHNDESFVWFFALLMDHIVKLSSFANKSVPEIAGPVSREFEFIVRILFARFEIDMDRWNWEDGHPPESIDLIDLEWPEDLKHVRERFAELRDMVKAPLMCLKVRNYRSSNHLFPNEVEVAAAAEELHGTAKKMPPIISSILTPLKEWCEKHKPQEEPKSQSEKGDESKPSSTVPTVPGPKGSEAIGSSEPYSQVESSVLSSRHDRLLKEVRNEEGVPILRIVSDGFYFHGTFERLTPVPLSLFREIAIASDHQLTVRRALQLVWPDDQVEEANVNTTIKHIRKALRSALAVSRELDPIPSFGARRNETHGFKLTFSFELIDELPKKAKGIGDVDL